MRQFITFCLNLLLAPVGWRTYTTPAERMFRLLPESYLVRSVQDKRGCVQTAAFLFRGFSKNPTFRLALRKRYYGHHQLQLEWSLPYLFMIRLSFHFINRQNLEDHILTKYWGIILDPPRQLALYWRHVLTPPCAEKPGWHYVYHWRATAVRPPVQG